MGGKTQTKPKETNIMDKRTEVKAQIGAALIALEIVGKTGDAGQLAVARSLIIDARDGIDLII